jgi:hypothetical protein
MTHGTCAPGIGRRWARSKIARNAPRAKALLLLRAEASHAAGDGEDSDDDTELEQPPGVGVTDRRSASLGPAKGSER